MKHPTLFLSDPIGLRSPAPRLVLAIALAASLLSSLAFADDAKEISLMSPGSQNLGWGFDNGQEFAGATGTLALDPDHKRQDHDALKLTGNFTGGGAYVQATCPVPKINIDKLTIWYRSPSMGQITLRLIDETGQCHQLKVNVTVGSSWERLVLPVADYFAGKEPGKRQDVTIVNGYESWGGANDKKWHGECSGLGVLIGPTPVEKVVSLWIADVSVTVKPPPPPATP